MSADVSGTGPIEVAGDVIESGRSHPRRRTRRGLLISGVVVLALLGAGLAGGAYFVDSVPAPSLPSLPSSTTLYYNDGSVLARLGQYDATALAPGEILP